MRITAAVLHHANKPYSIETVELDSPKRGEVLVKVRAAGVCRSDLHFQKGEATIAMPAVMGHEGSGVVQATGEGVTLVKPGDRVILSFVPNWGTALPVRPAGRTCVMSTHGLPGSSSTTRR